MRKKIIITAIALFILISIAGVSQSIVETSSAYPKIQLKFEKRTAIDPNYKALVNINDLEVNLTDRRGFKYELVFTNVPQGNISDSFNLTTTSALLNGNYTLTVAASDIIGNKINVTETLTMDVPYMGIWIDSPPLSVSPTPVFDLSIETAEDAYGCKYASSPLTDYSSAPYDFSDITRLLHTKFNFNNITENALTGFPDARRGLTNGKDTPIYVFCKDYALERTNLNTLSIAYDTTKPRILAVTLEPEIVTDRILGRVVLDAELEADDRVVCRYSNVIFNHTAPNGELVFTATQNSFTEMTNHFGEADDENNESKYSRKQKTTVDLTDLVTDLTKVHRFTGKVACINRATFELGQYGPERVSDAVTVTAIVNLLAPITIRKVSPADFITSGTIFLNFTTNKLANCAYEFNETSGQLSTADNRVHSAALAGNYPEGKYSLIISCDAELARATEEFEITIDTSPPDAPAILSPNATCTKELTATFSSSDNESGIAGYNYSIAGTGTNVTNKFVPARGSPPDYETTVTERDLNLSNHSTYSFSAIAINRAGLASTSGPGSPIIYDETGLLCDSNPPSVFIRQNTTSTGVFVRLICIDSETSCDNSSFSYYLSADTSCEGLFQPIFFDFEKEVFGVLVSRGGYFCYEAKDIAGNLAKGHEMVMFESESSCFNSIADGGETDVDCGGSTTCVRCDIGQGCIDDSDCVSRYCSSGTCQEASCTDGLRNGFETDVDCGGFLCPKCALEMSCLSSSDCESGYCNALGQCALPTCDDNATNGNETDIDCGGHLCEKCGLGKYCNENSDCITGSCIMGRCVQEPLEGEEMMPSPVGEEGILLRILKIIFLMLGVLGIFGGSGYIYYKKQKAPKKPPAPSAAAPGLAGEAAAKPVKKVSPEEKIRKLTIQEQLRREKEERELKREKLFGLFGAPGKRTVKIPLKAEPSRKARPSLKLVLPKKAAPKKKPEAEAREGIFEKLGRLEKEKEKDIFSRLGKLKGETEFEKLEKVGKGKKAEDIEKLRGKRKK